MHWMYLIIGIGVGRGRTARCRCSDVIGMYDRLQPKFAKQYAHTSEIICGALQAYREEVEQAKFPVQSTCLK